MKLSFVIPAHNEEAYLPKCLNSIFRELDKAGITAEVIVVDNASTDRTAEVAKKYERVRLVYEPNPGANGARQTGAQVATGDLIASLDADTMLNAWWLEKVFREFEKNQKLVALSGPNVYYDLPLHLRLIAWAFYLFAFPVYMLNNRILKRGASVMGGNVVIRRSALEAIGGYNTKLLFYGDDTDTATRLAQVGIVKFMYRFTIYSSGRRLRKEGIIRTGFRYLINYAWITLFRRPFTKKASVVR
jgi:glycosyltransferase involved in cell wall biosynthesis